MGEHGAAMVAVLGSLLIFFVMFVALSSLSHTSHNPPQTIIPVGTSIHGNLTGNGTWDRIYDFVESTSTPSGGMIGQVQVNGSGGEVCLSGPTYPTGHCDVIGPDDCAQASCLYSMSGLIPPGGPFSSGEIENGNYALTFIGNSASTYFLVVSPVQLT